MVIVIIFLLFWSCLGVLADSEWDILCKGVEPYSMVPHPYDCRKYILCLDGEEAFPNECPAGLAFDSILKDCFPEEIVSCAHISSTFDTTEGTTEGTTDIETTNPTESSSTTESSGSQWDYLCEGIPAYESVAHPNDCSKFFTCLEDGQAVPGQCPEGQAFSIPAKRCDFEENVDCSHIIETTTVGSTTEATSTEVSSTEETSPETTTPETTTEVSSSETTPTDSTTIASSTSTPEETTTEPSTTEGTSTAESSTSTPTTPEVTSPTPTVTYPPGTSITPGPEIPEPGVQCPPISTSNQDKPIFLPSKLDCSKYYLCHLGLPVPFWCQEGTHFNQFESHCDDPFYAHCQVDGYVDPNPYPECPRRGKVILPKAGNCEYFVYCHEGVGSLQKCPFYQGWDVKSQKCVSRSEAYCL